MKTLQPNGQLSANVPDSRDNLYPPAKIAGMSWCLQRDGIHIFYHAGDGKTVTHVHKPIMDILNTIEAADATLPSPKPPAKPR